MIPIPSGSYKNLSSSAAVTTIPGTLTGFYVNSTSSGVISLTDGGASGTILHGNVTPAIGWHFLPTSFTKSGGLYFTLVSGSINITFVINPTPVS